MGKRLWLFLAVCFMSVSMAFAQQTVKGTVICADDNQPAVGATIIVVDNTTIGTMADANGQFTLTVPKEATHLRISYIGMESQDVKIRPNMKIYLRTDENMLDEQVVFGYGSAKKLGTLSGAATVVSNKNLETNTTPNFTDALAGQVSGLSVLTASGEPTASASIRLRGVNSIESSNTPLFILDGAPISSTMFNTLNPADIASITVLKDASSTAIYGSRAANGVIVITSKKGKFNEKSNVTLRAQYGWSSPVEDGIKMMNSQQYVKFRDLIGQPVNDNIRNIVDKYGISTNWRDELLQNAPVYTLDATVTGGGEKISYYLSVNHHNQQGIVEASGMKRNAIRANIDSRVNEWLKVGLQSNLGVNSYELNSEANADDGIYLANPMVASRMAMPYDSPNYYSFDENGNIVWGDRAERLYYSGMTLPWYFNRVRDINRKIVTANLNLYEQITPIRGLTLRAQQAVDAYDYTLSSTNTPHDAYKTPMGSTISARQGSAQSNFSRYYQFTYTNTAEYKFNIDKHHFAALVGEESIIAKSRAFGVYTTGQTDDRQLRLTDGTTISISDDISDSRAETVLNSFFATLNYDWAEKYYLDLSFRTDGSSQFAPDHRWGKFWSVGAMWNAKKENFLKDVSWLTSLNLRVNYGTTGNNTGAGSYDYFGLIGKGSAYNGENSLGIASPSNNELTWEKVAQFNVGTTFRIFDRATFTVDYYNKKTSDMLMTIPYSYTTGFSGGSGNIASMTNKGVDLNVEVDAIKNKDWHWTVRANFNYNKNEITELFAGRDEYVIANTGLKLEVGKPYGEFYYVRYAGVDSRDGKPMWYTKEGNLTKTFNEERDAVFVGKQRYAPLSGGFGTSLRWKDLTISADFAWQAKKYMLNNDNYFVMNANFGTNYNQATDMLNIWTKPGDVTDIPAYGEGIEFDTHLLENASFLRLKNLTVQYLLPKKICQATKFFEAVKLFGVARNLFTITKFTGYDPEPDINLVQFNYPNTRQFVFGVEVSF